MVFFLRYLNNKVRNPVLYSFFFLGVKSTSWSQVTMKLHKFLTQLGFKYFIVNGTESLGEIEGHTDTWEGFMRTHERLFWILLCSEDLHSAVPRRPRSINWRSLRKFFLVCPVRAVLLCMSVLLFILQCLVVVKTPFWGTNCPDASSFSELQTI